MTAQRPKKCPVTSNGPGIGINNIEVLGRLSDFSREKTVERAVHAKGAGAYGEFEVTADIGDICNIDMLNQVGKKTPCVTRFSTTGLERGSSESVRDLKGMATRFFTKEGDWDWVCLNFPFFFIRDPFKFPDLMHSQQRDPKTNLLSPGRFWDFVSRNPESIHMALLQHSDYGNMFSWRSLSSYIGHCFKWVQADGSFKYAHFFLSSDQGPNFTDGTGADMDTNDPDSATRDLYSAIERGEYPSWTAHVQVVDPQDAPKLGFNILDVTKHWNLGTYPRGMDKIPSRPFGKLTLTRNVTDYHSEIEQLAFSPSNLVPGVEPSEDPILRARMFAYPDAQRYRLSASRSRRDPVQPIVASSAPDLGPEFAKWVAAVTDDAWSHPHPDDFKFAREYFEALPKFRDQSFQDRMVENISQSVAKSSGDVRTRLYRAFYLVSPDLEERVKERAEQIVMSDCTTAAKL